MPLMLRAVSLNDQPITQPIIARFGPDGGSIGRADSNTLALPDPERRISRRQAEICASGPGFVIKNVGSANPIIVRDQSLALGDSALLKHNDQVRIGGYLLEVRTEEGEFEDRTAVDAQSPPADPFALLTPLGGARQTPSAAKSGDHGVSAPSSPFADLGGPVSPGNPFAELLGGLPPGRCPLHERHLRQRRTDFPTISIRSHRRRSTLRCRLSFRRRTPAALSKTSFPPQRLLRSTRFSV